MPFQPVPIENHMRLAPPIVTLVDTINRYTAYVVAWSFFSVGLFVAYEVVMRKLGMPTQWTEEVSQVAQIWCIYLGAAYVLQQRQLITVDIISDRFSPLLRRRLDLFALLVIIGFSTVVLVQGIRDVAFSVKLGSTTDTALALPMWLIQISLPIGISLLLLQAVAEILKQLSADAVGGVQRKL